MCRPLRTLCTLVAGAGAWRRIAVSLGLAGAPWWGGVSALASESTLNTTPLGRVEITGSRLPVTGAGEGIAPLQVVTRRELQQSGAQNLRDWLDGLASGGGGSNEAGTSASFAAGASGASLRNMGSQATLVLLNGRRLAPYPLADYASVFTNLDSLPFEAIERIEVYKAGGAALYGSDAVAGVINVITRSDYRGVQGRVSHERSLRNNLHRTNQAVLAGGFDLPGSPSGRLLASAELYQRDGLVWRDVMDEVRPEVYRRSPNFGSWSSYSWPGNVIGAAAVPGCAPEQQRNGLCMYDRYQRFEVLPEARRANLLLDGRLPLEGGRELFSEAVLAQARTLYLQPYMAYGPGLGRVTWGDPATGSGQTFTYRGLPAGHPLNTTGQDNADLRYRFVDAPSQVQVETTQYRWLLGGRGPLALQPPSLLPGLAHWDWEAAGGLMGGRSRMRSRGAFSASGFREVIGNDDPAQTDPLFFQRGYRIGQANDAAVIDRLFPEYGYTGELTQVFVDGRIRGDLARLAAGPLTAVLGADLRHERHRIRPSEALAQGDIVGSGLTASDGERLVGALFGETALPLSPTLDAQLALRLDAYQGVGPHLSPKLAMRWTPSPGWSLRGTLEGGFRAPNLTENSASTKFTFDNGVADPQRCPQAQALAADLRNQAAALPAGDAQKTLLSARADSLLQAECSAGVANIVSHNPDLQPETSRAATLGLVLSPSRHWRLALDAWAIDRRHEIGLSGSRELLSAEAVAPAGTIVRAPLTNDRSFSADEQARYGVSAGSVDAVVTRFQNQSRTRNRGVDLAAVARGLTPWGPLELTADLTYQVELRFWSAVRNGWGDNLAGRRSYPRWRGSVAATLGLGRWSHTLRGFGLSSTALQGDFYETTYTPAGCAAGGWTPSECRLAGFIRWDYALNLKANADLNILVNIVNVFDLRAPYGVASWVNGGGIWPIHGEEARGRMLKLTVEQRW